MKNRLTLTLAALALCVAANAAQTLAQTPPARQTQKEATASVSGRVRVGERPAAGVHVLLLPAENFGPERRAVARARTNAEGLYRMTGVPAGRYELAPSAPAHVIVGATMFGPGVVVMLSAGESFDDADFTLEPGGVITGRVTDSDGRAVVGESLRIDPIVDPQAPPAPPRRVNFSPLANQTDDRGVYRVYGLPAGRYRVSVGFERGGLAFGPRTRGYYERTFHPDTTDAARAKVVELAEGGEATDVDITLGRLSQTFKARGLAVNASTGQPAAGVMYGLGPIEPRQGRLMFGGIRSETNARGEFVIEGLMPGKYGIYVASDRPTDTYSDPTTFEVTDSDVAGLELRVQQGSSMSGVVTIEGLADRALAAQLLQRLSLFANAVSRDNLTPPRVDRTPVNPDGSFRVTGLRPGKVSLYMTYPPVKGLSLLRTELNGAEQREGIDVPAGAHVEGVRLVFVYGTGVVRGQVVVRRGDQPDALPPGTRLSVSARRPGGQAVSSQARTEADSRGRFLLEGLPAGELELVVDAFGPGARANARQNVFVQEGAESGVQIVLDLNQQNQGPGRRPNPQ